MVVSCFIHKRFDLELFKQNSVWSVSKRQNLVLHQFQMLILTAQFYFWDQFLRIIQLLRSLVWHFFSNHTNLVHPIGKIALTNNHPLIQTNPPTFLVSISIALECLSGPTDVTSTVKFLGDHNQGTSLVLPSVNGNPFPKLNWLYLIIFSYIENCLIRFSYARLHSTSWKASGKKEK